MEATQTTAPFLTQVRNVLSDSTYLSEKHLHIEAADGHVRIQGTVGTFFEKQMAQELIRRVDGVERIENQLQVNWS